MVTYRKVFVFVLFSYLVYILTLWFWLTPSLVDKRVGTLVARGMTDKQVATKLKIYDSFTTDYFAYCSPKSLVKFNRISIYHAGSVPLFPIPMVIATTTTFCFNEKFELIDFHSVRNIDGP